MLKVLSCIRQEHDPRLVLAAAIVCLLATSTAVWLYGRTREQSGAWRLAWLALTGAAAGSGVWATHFIAMLAYAPQLQTGYDLGGTALSLVLAILSATVGFGLAARSSKAASLAGAGAIIGGGVGLMHFVGMAAFRPRGLVIWDVSLAVAALAIGVALAVAALLAAGPRPRLARAAAAALLLALAICGLHFTAMAAAVVLPDPTVMIPTEFAARPVMAAIVAAVAALILLAAVLIGIFEAAHRRAAVNKLRIAVDAMPAALAVYDADDRLVVWNGTYQNLRPHYATLLRPGLAFEDLARADGHDEAWIANRKRERRQGRPLEHRFPGDVWVRIDNMKTADGGLITVGVDVSELKRHSEALARALEQAEAANRAKAEFLANMSHEIRTPLNGVAGVAEVLAGTGLNQEQLELLGVIRSSAETLDTLIGEILDLSRFESGDAEAVSSVFNLAAVVRSVARLHRPSAVQAGVGLELELPPEVDVEVEGDGERLKQILNALLSNAVKFTDHGQVVVRALALEGDLFRLEVEDTGMGFDDSIADRLFDRFAQGDGSATRRHGGAGLGLALARKCADLVGAKLRCRSEPGVGSVFTLDVGLRRAGRAGPAGAIVQAPLDAGPSRAPMALVVDDNATNRRVLQLILDQLGVGSTAAEDGARALEAWEARPFDVILMDVQMPVMDGLAATREIRRRELAAGRASTPVIIVSANCMAEHVQAGLDAGAQLYLAKPVDMPALVEALEALLPLERREAPRTKSGDGGGLGPGNSKASQEAA